MTQITKLSPSDMLPLTCSRTGTCCHGKAVWLNPWELACLASAKKMTSLEFRDAYCDFGGIRLAFDGPLGWKNLPACSQYVSNFGCSVHTGRPLACRLYPLGRQRQSDVINYMYEGTEFPCLEGCPEVTSLPKMSVQEYIIDQKATTCEKAQDEYLELMQNLADGAFALLLDTGLAKSGDTDTLKMWRVLGAEPPEQLQKRLGSEWINRLLVPNIPLLPEDPATYMTTHYKLLQDSAQDSFGSLNSAASMHYASVLMMGLALHLARGLGVDPKALSEHWISTAKKHGAKER